MILDSTDTYSVEGNRLDLHRQTRQPSFYLPRTRIARRQNAPTRQPERRTDRAPPKAKTRIIRVPGIRIISFPAIT